MSDNDERIADLEVQLSIMTARYRGEKEYSDRADTMRFETEHALENEKKRATKAEESLMQVRSMCSDDRELIAYLKQRESELQSRAEKAESALAECARELDAATKTMTEAAGRAEDEVAGVLSAVGAEVRQARANWPAFNSAHEGFAVLAEEVDELWDHVKTNQRRRDLEQMRKEAIQVAAMGVRFALEVCGEERGRK